MGSAISIFAILVVITVVAGVAFAMWTLGFVIHIFVSMVRGVFGLPRAPRPALGPGFVLCRNLRCAQPNPRGATYCRRCGQPLGPTAGGGSGRTTPFGAVNTAGPWFSRCSMDPAHPARQWRVALRERLRQAKFRRRQARILRRQARLQRRQARAMFRNSLFSIGVPPYRNPESDARL